MQREILDEVKRNNQTPLRSVDPNDFGGLKEERDRLVEENLKAASGGMGDKASGENLVKYLRSKVSCLFANGLDLPF